MPSDFDSSILGVLRPDAMRIGSPRGPEASDLANDWINVLVLEDDDEDALQARDYLLDGLPEYQLSIDFTRNCQEALEKLGNLRYDVVLVDYLLGREDGIAFIKRMRNRGVRIPSIVLTGHHDYTAAIDAMKAGASDYLLKSRITASVLALAVRQAIETHRHEERKASGEDAVVRSAKRQRALLDCASVAIGLIDRECTFVYANPATAKVLGCVGDEMIGRNALEYVHPDDLVNALAAFHEALAKPNREVVSEFRRWHGDGNWRQIEARLVNREQDRQLEGVVVSYADVTERRNAERLLREAKDSAEGGLEAKRELVASLSHEIRTPLSSIAGIIDIALDMEVPPEQVGYLQIAKHAADSLLDLINDILDLSKLEAGKLELVATDFRLRDCLADTLQSLGFAARHRGLELVYQVGADVPDHLVGDPGRLRQVIVNLVSNAIKFTDHGEISVRVDLESREAENVTLGFSVKDNGIGIPAARMASIFDAFVQGDANTSAKYGGTGLGLPIASRLVSMMGSKIRVESEPSVGSTFRFSLELQVAEGMPDHEASPAAVEGLRVLIVDDNATNRATMAEMLAGWRAEVAVADSADHALVLLKDAQHSNRPIQLVLVDANMPEVDGFELVERIKKHPGLAVVPVMIMTAIGQRGDAARCRKLHIASYLHKPISASALLQAMTIVLRGETDSKESPRLVTRHTVRESSAHLEVLVVEDNVHNEMVVTHQLKRQGHRVTVAHNGLAAVEAVKKRRFDLVLMDVQMPVMDGLEATQTIRAHEATSGQHVPIVAMTARALGSDRQSCLRSGMDSYLSKPVRARDLSEVIKSLGLQPEEAAAQEEVESEPRRTLDTAAMLDAAGGNRSLLGRMVRAFDSQSRTLLRDIRHAFARGDAEAVSFAAHSLKGSISNWYQGKAWDVARRLEKLGRSGKIDEARSLHESLRQEVAELKKELTVMLKEL